MLALAVLQGLPLLLAQLHMSHAQVDLRVIAQSSSRPALCAQSPLGVDRWEQARTPHAAQYCHALARGHTLLVKSPGAALESALRAATLLPKEEAPIVLAARARTALGEYDKAWELFGRTRIADRLAQQPVDVLHDYARAARIGGDGVAARGAYRQLMSRADLMADKRRLLSACIEAAFAVLPEGERGHAEALLFMQQAERQNDSTRLPQVVGAAMKLVVDWRSEDARKVKTAPELLPDALAAEIKKGLGLYVSVLTDLEREALAAVTLEYWDAGSARELWLTLAQQANAQDSNWRVEAQRRAEALR